MPGFGLQAVMQKDEEKTSKESIHAREMGPVVAGKLVFNTSGYNPVMQISVKKGFANFSLNLTEEENASLKALRIECLSHYENYGSLELIPCEVRGFIQSLGSGNSEVAETITRIVMRQINSVLKYTGAETAWITMRAYTPIPNFAEPRWHADNYYYPTQTIQYKVAITLKGVSTLFYDSESKEREQLELVRTDKVLLKKALTPSKIVSAETGQGSIFVVGACYAPIHSEPNINSERLLLSMVPGSKEQIRKLYKRTPEQQIMLPLLQKGFYCYFLGPKLKDKYIHSPYEETGIIIFNLFKTRGESLLKAISDIVTSQNSKIQAEILESNCAVKFVFSGGAVIVVDDISDYMLDAGIKKDSDVYSALLEYSKRSPMQESQPINTAAAARTVNTASSSSSATPVSKPKFSFNAILGANTSGLFVPKNVALRINAIVKIPRVVANGWSNPLLNINNQTTFTHYNLDFSQGEIDALKSLKIEYTSHYENYGELALVPYEVQGFVESLSNKNISISRIVASVITRVVDNILYCTGQQTAWITLRAFTPVNAFAEPRWHRDRFDYPPSGEQYKGAVTLKGDGTIFYNELPSETAALNRVKHDKKLLDQVLDKTRLASAPFGLGTLFIVGADNAPIHSEPHITTERLFLAVVTGSKEQIEKVYRQTPEQEIMPLLLEQDFYCYFVGPKIKDKFKVSPYEETEIIVFKTIDSPDTDLLNKAASIVTSHNKRITAELPADDPTLLRLSLPEGGVILIRDISAYYLMQKKTIRSPDDIYKVLQEYMATANSCVDQLYTESATTSATSNKPCLARKLTYSAIPGRNTCGLFKPCKELGTAIQTQIKTEETDRVVFKSY
ncbi:MAG: hypothetical protein CFE62_003740 [Candidatus Aquirickettsiella gammari]|uniref:Uncharacterized protein n=1 Tax=Candidatus Aquirickettsiella gammari TaxID=2016198 RepID=A0A370CHY7_9COXI|nr:MAG: hypothetical protein CFE62_003740 [Candidatus Aquirickettsiella gammari]